MKRLAALLFLLGLTLSCATSYYNQAENMAEQGLHQDALREYSGILKTDKQQTGTYTDIRALSGAAASYYELGRYKNVQKLCRLILKLDPKSGSGFYYAGASLEAINKPAYALRFFKQYWRVPPSDPYRPFLEARTILLKNESQSKNMLAAIRDEEILEIDNYSQNSITILNFQPQTDSPEMDALSKGLTELLLYDLSQVKQIKTVPREQMEMLKREMQWSKSDLTDVYTVPRFGHILGSRNVLSGTIETSGKNLTLNVTLNDVVEMIANDPDVYTGPMSKILRMEKDILLGILKQLDVQPAKADESQMLKIHTDDFDAFMAFSKGLDFQDQGLLSSAVDYFKEAYELDPGFELARERFLLIEAMQVISSGLSVTEFIASKHGRAYATSVTSPEFMLQTPLDAGTMGRLQRSGYYLNLGQVPGQEYRYEATDLEFNGISVERKQLLPPPAPPIVGE